MSKYEVVKVDAKQFVSLVKQMPFSTKQVNLLLSRTPERFIKSRPIPGGGRANFVSTQYMINALNLITGFRWSFDILDEKEKHGQIVVKGQLTVVFKDGTELVKTQFGRALIKLTKAEPKTPIDYGNDFKAAASDALKKCASLLGIAWDVYGSDEFNEIQIVDKIIQEKNKEIEQIEVLAEPIDKVKARVEAKLETLGPVEKMRAIKVTGHTSPKQLADSDWRLLDEELKTNANKGESKGGQPDST